MAAFNGLIDPQCGNVNPFVQLSQNYTQDKTRILQDGLLQASSNNVLDVDSNRTVNQFVQEFHRPLDAPTSFQLDRILTNLHIDSDPVVDQRERQWTREFFVEPTSTNTSLTRYQQNPSYNNFVRPDLLSMTDYSTFNYPMMTNSLLPSTNFDQPMSTEEKNLREYLKEMETSNSKILSTSETISTVESNNTVVNDRIFNYDMFSSMFDDLNFDERKEIATEYKFIENNPYLNHADPFQAGCERLKVHDIVNAALYFEAAVQKDPNHIAAWLHLGMTMSENEQDLRAIPALNKCLALDPNNLTAYLILSSCYANESLVNESAKSLLEWMSHHPEYSKFAPSKSIENLTIFDDIQNAFLLAISSTREKIDSDLQVGLGVLFHLSCDYEKAAECFQTAVSANPNDARLWNKLGASLANGGESGKAVNAYYQALSLAPGFVRARYNLGISCFNLRVYAQAVEHFLTALKQQSEGIGPMGTHVQMSENIWRTLGVSLSHLDRDDLTTAVNNRDLSTLLKQFRID